MSCAHLKGHCFVNAPFYFLKENIATFIEQGVQPEIGLGGDVLYTESVDDFRRVAARLTEHNLACTLHAPFFELYVGSLDFHIREVSRHKIRKAFQLIEVFRPRSIVCHLGFEENKHGYKEAEWFERSLEGWEHLLELAAAHETPMMLENTYETSPVQHEKMLAALDSPYARFCLDVGHVMAFARNTWQDWLPALEPWLGQLHLHDNHGIRDTHLAPGQGLFDFPGFFAYLATRELTPLVTLEPHQEKGMDDSFRALDEMGLRFDETSGAPLWPADLLND